MRRIAKFTFHCLAAAGIAMCAYHNIPLVWQADQIGAVIIAAALLLSALEMLTQAVEAIAS